MKQEEKPKQQTGNQTDPVLEAIQVAGMKPTQALYLALAHPEGMDSESEQMLPKEFHSLPKE